MDKIIHLVRDYGIDKAIKIHENRISYAKTHPRNPFFISVKHDSSIQLEKLKNIKNDTKGI